MNKKIYGFRRGLLALLALMGMTYASSAQVGVGTTTPDPSAQLQIESGTKGLLIPRVTTTASVTTPATGLIVFQTGGTAGFYYNSGTSVSPEWLKLATGSTEIADGTITNAKVSSTAGIAYSKLALSNAIVAGDITSGAITPAKISTTGAASGNVLTYNGTAVEWAAPTGGGSSDVNAFSASNAASTVIPVVLGGTDVPLPDYQKMNTFTVDGTNTDFTVPVTGQYRVDYRISTTAALLISTRVLQNGAPIAASVISPVNAKDEFHCSFLINLTEGDVLTLQMFGLLGAATLSGGASNGMTVQKL